jgi:anti-sigma B factor antagonist
MSVEDLQERAVDQLVDETLARVHDLRHLLATEQLASWPGADVRTGATQVIAQLITGPSRYRTARALVSSLWDTDDPARVPATWWATPLGGLLLDSMRPAAPPPPTTTLQATPALHDGLPQPVRDRPIGRSMLSPSPTSSPRDSEHPTPRSMTMTDLPTDFGVAIVQVDGHTKVRVTGEIDLATAPQLRQRLDSVIAAGTGDVDLDVSDVTFLDSSGLVVLLAARQGLHDKRHRLRVRNPSEPVLRVFELSGLLDVMMDGRQPSGDSARAAEG